MNYTMLLTTRILKPTGKITSKSFKNRDWVTIMMIISNYKQFQNDF